MCAKSISLSNEAYELLNAQRKKGESFSDLILRKFGKGSPSAILTLLKESEPNLELADRVEEASRELRKNFKTRNVKL